MCIVSPLPLSIALIKYFYLDATGMTLWAQTPKVCWCWWLYFTTLKEQTQELVFYREKKRLPRTPLRSEVPLLILFTQPPSPYLTRSIYPEGVFNFPQGETLPLRGALVAEQAAWRSSVLYHGYQELDTP